MKSRKKQKMLVFVILAIAAAVCIWQLIDVLLKDTKEKQYIELRQIVKEYVDSEENTYVAEESDFKSNEGSSENDTAIRENAIKVDFEVLKEINQDIYAWITIQDTGVDYPILQNDEDNYYIKRCIDGSSGYPGCIYTNKCDEKDFSSWNTVIYGHNMKNGTMFGSLKNPEEWFDSVEFIEINIPEQIYKYRIYAAAVFTDVYLPNAYDESSETERERYLIDIKNAAKESGCLREDMNVSVEDKLITLSTCIKGKSNKRLLIVGVLQ